MKTHFLSWSILVLIWAGPTVFGDELSDVQKNHWAWKPPVRHALPAVQQTAWVRNAIDAFILARLEAAGLQAAPPATREQLLRRVTFDLIGLPPTPEQIDAF